MYKSLAILASAFSFFCTVAFGQQKQPELPKIDPSTQPAASSEQVTQVTVDELGGNLVMVYRSTKVLDGKKLYYYLPYPAVDWLKLEEIVERECAVDKSGVAISLKSIPLPIDLYWEEAKQEIRRRIIDQVKPSPDDSFEVGTPPNVSGITAYVYDQQENPYEVMNTFPTADHLRGIPLSAALSAFPKDFPGQIRASCGDLRSIARRKYLRAFLFGIGAKAKVSRMGLVGSELLKKGLISKMNSEESQVKFTKVESSSSGGQLVINAGPLLVGGGSQSGGTSTNVDQKRFVNREWFKTQLESAVTEAKIDAFCDEDGCGTTTPNELFNFFFGQLKEERIRIVKEGQKMYAVQDNDTKTEIQTIKVNDEVSAKLSQIGKGKENTEVGFDGFSAKNDNQKERTDGSEIKFKRDGQDWVPTTFKAYVVSPSYS